MSYGFDRHFIPLDLPGESASQSLRFGRVVHLHGGAGGMSCSNSFARIYFEISNDVSLVVDGEQWAVTTFLDSGRMYSCLTELDGLKNLSDPELDRIFANASNYNVRSHPFKVISKPSELNGRCEIELH